MGSNKTMNGATLELTQKVQSHFPRNISDEILKAWNGVEVKVITERLEEIFGKMPEIPEEHPISKFYVIAEFFITVPLDYDPKKHLKNFAKKYRKDFFGYNDNITDQKEYSNPSHEFIPGKRYKVIIWGINKGMIATNVECLQLLSDNNVLLTSAPGLSVVHQQAKEMLPKGKWIFSYDNENKLWKDASGYLRVPSIYRRSGGGDDFGLSNFERDRGDLGCLVGFCDCESSAA